MLAIEHVLADQSGITGLVLASSMISMPLYQTEVDILRSQLPKTVQATLRRHEKAGTTDSTEYTSAMQQYNKRHLYRGTNYPDAYRAPKGSFCEASYIKLWGQSEAYPDGNLRHWDRSNDLHAIAVPTLITSGQYDELTPAQAVFTHDNIPGSKLAIFTGASHLAHIEREKDYMQTVAEFLKAL